MNRSHPLHRMAFTSSLAGTLALVAAVTALSLVCHTPAADAPRVASDAASRNGTPEPGRDHCLIYGKYCLTALLRGR
jgi:hypothetical protein